MSEPAPEPQGGQPQGGSFMSRRFLGIPAVVWLIGAALLAYLYFRNQSSSSTGGATSTAGSGQSTTGDITFTPGTSTVEVAGTNTPSTNNTQQNTQQTTNNSATPNPQPTPNPKPPTKSTTTTMKKYTVKKGQSLSQVASQFGIDVACLAHNNKYVSGEVPGNKKVGQPLGTGAGLKTGQVLSIPTNAQCKAQGYKS